MKHMLHFHNRDRLRLLLESLPLRYRDIDIMQAAAPTTVSLAVALRWRHERCSARADPWGILMTTPKALELRLCVTLERGHAGQRQSAEGGLCPPAHQEVVEKDPQLGGLSGQSQRAGGGEAPPAQLGITLL